MDAEAGPATVRPYVEEDREAVVALALRAWAPVFASMRDVLGAAVDEVVHGTDWRLHQRSQVEAALADGEKWTRVAERDGSIVGFVVVSLDPAQSVGEVWMVAVDPDAQRLGIGTALTRLGVDHIAASGMRVAMIGTGGDAGHAPARRVYEALGFRPMPIVQYYKAL
jgi:ribosomal protein S18 acetylase RimI-like enzyme